jgi:hypothetical protein
MLLYAVIAIWPHEAYDTIIVSYIESKVDMFMSLFKKKEHYSYKKFAFHTDRIYEDGIYTEENLVQTY